MAPRSQEQVSEPSLYVLSQSPPQGCPDLRARGNWGLLQSAGQARLVSSPGVVSNDRGLATETARKPVIAAITWSVGRCMVGSRGGGLLGRSSKFGEMNLEDLWASAGPLWKREEFVCFM